MSFCLYPYVTYSDFGLGLFLKWVFLLRIDVCLFILRWLETSGRVVRSHKTCLFLLHVCACPKPLLVLTYYIYMSRIIQISSRAKQNVHKPHKSFIRLQVTDIKIFHVVQKSFIMFHKVSRWACTLVKCKIILPYMIEWKLVICFHTKYMKICTK